ncbi:MAG: bifunctional 4-hydroxy-2-oxoglutarate aldolase/2-dehydro-3-deoxy-phosphogluconate aldolase [Eubacteriales bacterium]|nr:bifunctional 4-hydroxy-2-oxoglutarate aldolase/2-dehydro-3-deoxy-phosphogluconate aldolase [Eubacteriales bacterium]
MSSIIDRISAIGIMPVITKIDSPEDCDALAKALTAGGIPAMEITFRMEGADTYIRHARKNHPNVLVGAGTVITMEQTKQAIAAGAQFIVAPGLNAEIVRYCQAQKIDVIPGIATPSELEAAIGLGLSTVKFFPAEQNGGIDAIKAICGPYSGVGFMPTGGLNLNNLAGYFAFDRIIACGGTYMLGAHMAKKEWAQVTELCKKSVQTMLNIKLAHVGMNEANEESARAVAASLAEDGNSSVFVDKYVEVMKNPYLGKRGHIGFTTSSVERAVRYYKALGVAFHEDSAKYSSSGKLNAIYFKDEVGGFAIHLVNA